MTPVPIMIPYDTNSSCDISMALFDKISLTLIVTLIIVALILILFDDGFDLFKWIIGCFAVSVIISFVWFIHAIWF